MPHPPEWTPQSAIYTAWPRLTHEWADDLAPARAELAWLVQELARPRPANHPPAPRVFVLAGDDAARADAQATLGRIPGVTLVDAPYGDIWLRDIAPLFHRGPDGAELATAFRFDGWGGKYDLPGDQETAAAVARHAGVPLRRAPLVAEGGALEHDDTGLVLTTEACLLGPPRNPGLDRAGAEAQLRDALGPVRVVWLDACLENDHTDGHVDTLARFAPDGRVLYMTPTDDADPNAATLRALGDQLARALPDRPRHPVPSPGRVTSRDGQVLPASYLNFVVSNGRVLVPTYGTPNDGAAVAAIAQAFPEHVVVGGRAKALLTGGGAFHCITQERPRWDLDQPGGGARR